MSPYILRDGLAYLKSFQSEKTHAHYEISTVMEFVSRFYLVAHPQNSHSLMGCQLMLPIYYDCRCLIFLATLVNY